MEATGHLSRPGPAAIGRSRREDHSRQQEPGIDTFVRQEKVGVRDVPEPGRQMSRQPVGYPRLPDDAERKIVRKDKSPCLLPGFNGDEMGACPDGRPKSEPIRQALLQGDAGIHAEFRIGLSRGIEQCQHQLGFQKDFPFPARFFSPTAYRCRIQELVGLVPDTLGQALVDDRPSDGKGGRSASLTIQTGDHRTQQQEIQEDRMLHQVLECLDGPSDPGTGSQIRENCLSGKIISLDTGPRCTDYGRIPWKCGRFTGWI